MLGAVLDLCASDGVVQKRSRCVLCVDGAGAQQRGGDGREEGAESGEVDTSWFGRMPRNSSRMDDMCKGSRLGI